MFRDRQTDIQIGLQIDMVIAKLRSKSKTYCTFKSTQRLKLGDFYFIAILYSKKTVKYIEGEVVSIQLRQMWPRWRTWVAETRFLKQLFDVEIIKIRYFPTVLVANNNDIVGSAASSLVDNHFRGDLSGCVTSLDCSHG